MPTCVVIDTNVWVYRTRLLRAPVGAALLHAIIRGDALLGLPEVVEQEVVKHTKKEGARAAKLVHDGYKIVEILIGTRDDYRLPSPEDYIAAAESRFRDIGERLVRVPFTYEHAKGALHRVMNETSPNSEKSQQFKDSAIWEAILELAQRYAVHFVTQDKGFFEGAEPKKGLARSLLEDIEKVSHLVKVYYGPEDFLAGVRQDLPPIDEARVAQEVESHTASQVGEFAREKGFTLQARTGQQFSFYLTERIGSLAVTFQLVYDIVVAPEGEDAFNGRLRVHGSCRLDVPSYVIAEAQLDSIRAEELDGTTIAAGSVAYLRGAAVIGRRSIPYTLRSPLEEQ
jgi:hypothetical protein